MSKSYMFLRSSNGVLAAVIIIVIGLSFTALWAAQQKTPDNAHRLTLNYKDGQMDLLIVEPLTMILPVTVKEQIMADSDLPHNYYFEIRDENEKIIQRSNMEDPTVTLMEYEDPEKPGKIKSNLVKHDDITFSILISMPQGARYIRFTRIAPGQEEVPLINRKHEILGNFNLKDR